jgi:hypothetical protein
MTNAFYSEKPITDFRELGTGRQANKVVVVNCEGRILFISELRRNHRSLRKVTFANRKTFLMDSQTLDWGKVDLYLWSERLETSWRKQCEADSIEEWMKTTFPKHIFAFLECVGEVRGIETPKYRYDVLCELAKIQIRGHLDFLSLVELRRLTAMLEAADPSEATALVSTGQLARERQDRNGNHTNLR